jgi:hypothetical protein
MNQPQSKRDLILDVSSYAEIAPWFTSYDTLNKRRFIRNSVKFGALEMWTETHIDSYSPGAPQEQLVERVKRTVGNLAA